MVGVKAMVLMAVLWLAGSGGLAQDTAPPLSSVERLEAGRALVKKEEWAAAKEMLSSINEMKRHPPAAVRAEANFLLGQCLERLDNPENAVRAYNVVVAVYGDQTEWASRSAERAFLLANDTEDPKKKLQAYRFLRKVTHQLGERLGDREPPAALERVRDLLARTILDLGLSLQRQRAIDRELGIPVR